MSFYEKHAGGVFVPENIHLYTSPINDCCLRPTASPSPLFHPQHCLFSLVLISFWHFPISQLIWLYMQALTWSGAELIFCLISGECMALALLSLTEEKICVCGQDVHGIVWDYKKKEQGDKRGGAGKGGITYTRLRDRWKYSCVCFWHREKEMWEERKCHGWKY